MHIYASITFLLLILLPGQSQTKYTTVNGRRLVIVTDDVVCEFLMAVSKRMLGCSGSVYFFI